MMIVHQYFQAADRLRLHTTIIVDKKDFQVSPGIYPGFSNHYGNTCRTVYSVSGKTKDYELWLKDSYKDIEKFWKFESVVNRFDSISFNFIFVTHNYLVISPNIRILHYRFFQLCRINRPFLCKNNFSSGFNQQGIGQVHRAISDR